MDKRYEPMKEYGRVNKKPKLEIIVNKKRPNQSSVAGNARNTGKSKSPTKSSPDDLWDDDDDEVILLASQVVEKEMPPGSALVSMSSMDFTFSQFVPNAKVTSTQKPAAPDVELFSDLLNDDWGVDHVPEEPVFKIPTIIPPRRSQFDSEKGQNQKTLTDRPFSSLSTSAMPILSQTTSNGVTNSYPSIPISLSQSAASNKPSNREKAHECQIQFLQKRADTLKKENTKLTKELDEFKNKMESKDGEVSLLRDEIRHLKQQIQNVNREKLTVTDAAKGEWQRKMNELSKQLESQQAALEFKTMEISKLKIHNADESMRFEHSMRAPLNESIAQQSNMKMTSANRRRMSQWQGSALLNIRIPTSHDIPIEFFDHSTEKGNNKFRKDVFQREMERLQFQMSRLQHVDQLKPDVRIGLAESVVQSAKNVFVDFWTYVHSLEYNKHLQSLPFHAFVMEKEIDSSSSDRNLFQADSLFPGEKAINLRRFVAGLSVVCRLVPETSALLFSIHHNEYLLIQIITDALNKLGFSHEVSRHFGVVESFALLLNTLWTNHIKDDSCQEHLISYFKFLVFCRPNAWASRYITRCLLSVPIMVCGQFCCNSRAQTFSVSQAGYKFAPESCVFQVYAAMLEIAFPMHQELNASQFQLLSEICYNQVMFFTNCFVDPPSFVMDILPCDDDMEDDGLLSQQPTVNIKCQCYVMMCSSLIKLLYQVLRQWQRTNCQQELKLVENVSKVGVRLIHTIIIRYYMTKLFDHKGYLTRHYLYFICKYWLEYADALQFTETDREALDQLASSHIIEINTSQAEPDIFKVDRDLMKWYKHSGDSKSNRPESMNVDDEMEDMSKPLPTMDITSTGDTFFSRY